MIYNKIAKSTISQKCGYNIIKLHKKKLQLQIAKSAITDYIKSYHINFIIKKKLNSQFKKKKNQ